MALQTYTDLKASIAGFLNRTDLTAVIPDFITLAEARLNRDLRLRVMESDQPLSTVIGSRLVALPAGYLEPLALFHEWTSGRKPIDFVSDRMITSSVQGSPRHWTVDGSNIAFERPSDQVYSLTFKMLQSFALSDAAPTNWLLTNYPDIYLAASLVEGFGYLKNPLADQWQSKYDRALYEINAKENRGRSMATLRSDMPTTRQRRGSNFDINTGL